MIARANPDLHFNRAAVKFNVFLLTYVICSHICRYHRSECHCKLDFQIFLCIDVLTVGEC